MTEPAAALYHPNIGQACALVGERARRHFEAADAVMKRWPRRTVRTPRVMGEVYKLKLDGVVARGFAPPRPPVHLSRLQLLLVLLRYAVI